MTYCSRHPQPSRHQKWPSSGCAVLHEGLHQAVGQVVMHQAVLHVGGMRLARELPGQPPSPSS